MLRLWRAPRLQLARGFAALPVKAAGDGVAARKKQAEYYAKITETFPRYRRSRFSEEALNRALVFLTDRGISKTNAMRAIARFPMMVWFQRETLEGKIAWLEELGLSHDKINASILRNPSMLGQSIEKYMAMADWYLAHGVPKEKLPFLFNVGPTLLSLSLDNLDSKLDFFRESGFTEQITCILKRAPQVFSYTTENMNSKLDYMVRLGVPRERLLELVPNAPEILGFAATRIQETVDALDEMFGDGASVQALVGNLGVIRFNVEGLRRSFNYLVSVVGLTPERLSTSSKYICRSRDNILRPRFEFLKTQGVETVATLSWITRSHREFVEKYCSYIGGCPYESCQRALHGRDLVYRTQSCPTQTLTAGGQVRRVGRKWQPGRAGGELPLFRGQFSVEILDKMPTDKTYRTDSLSCI